MPVERCEAPNKALAEGCAIIEVPENRVVTERRGAVYCAPLEFSVEYGLHEHTIDEELRTLCNRHLFETPEPQTDSTEWDFFLKEIKALSRQIGRVPRCKFSALLKTKNGRKLSRYWGGIQRYLEKGIRYSDSRVTEMQKLEFYEYDKISEKEDRGIQFRSTQYNAVLASHLWNVEHRLIHLHNDGNRMVMKGLRPDDRMKHITIGAAKYRDPVFFLLDHSRFDAHVNMDLLKAEHSVYMYCRNKHPELRKLLKWQLTNLGYSFGGIKYKVRAKRMSGDVNTSLGNTILNLCMLRAWLAFNGIVGSIYLDGDDSVVIMEREDSRKVMDYPDFFLKLGMKTEGEVVDDLFAVEFCQSKPCWISEELKAVRNPYKVISTVGRTPNAHDVLNLKRVVAATCLCEKALNGTDVPIISPVVKKVYDTVAHVDPMVGNSWEYKVENNDINIGPTEKWDCNVTESNRYFMWRSWGVPPGEQVMMEQQSLWVNDAVVANEEKVLKKPKELEYPVDWIWGENLNGCDCDDCPELDEEAVFEQVARFM